MTTTNLDANLSQSSDCLAPDINPNRCQWERLHNNKNYLHPGCTEIVTYSVVQAKQWVFCPYCGRKILK